MIKLFKILLCQFAFLFLLFAFAAPVSAQRYYVVRPYLVIPADWNTPEIQEQIPTYKENILQALDEVQSWYAKTLNGKTFNLNREVRVIFPEAAVGDRRLWSSISDLKPREEKSVVNISWIVGMWKGNAYGVGDRISRDSGYAVLSYDALLDLEGRRGNSVKTTAHELGHAFGLVFSGHAKAHTCSEVSEHECRENAPKPLPPTSEWGGSVMRTGLWELGLTGLNNSIHNPEIWKIYKSPFINPGDDPPPKPIGIAKPPPVTPYISSVNPQPVKVGEVLEVRGEEFGETKGFVNLYQNLPGFSVGYAAEQIIQWSPNLIKFIVNVPTTRMCVNVPIPDKPTNTVSSCIDIKTEGKPLPPVLNISLEITCGEYKQPVSIFTPSATLVALNKRLGDREEQLPKGVIVATSQQSKEKSSIAVQLAGGNEYWALPKGNYILRAYPFEGITPAPETIPISITDTSRAIEMSADFHYPICPIATSSPTPITTSTPTTVIEEEEEEEIEEETPAPPPEFITPYATPVSLEEPVSIPAPPPEKEVVSITINNEPVVLDGSSGARVSLPGTVGQAETFFVPIVITYSDGTTRELVIRFNYQPDAQGEEPVTIPITPEPPSVTCPEPYNQCGGTTGLEEYETANTIKVTPICDTDGNITQYDNQDLGNLEECCDDIYYPDYNTQECIHKWSPSDPYPACEYTFDPVDNSFCGGEP